MADDKLTLKTARGQLGEIGYGIRHMDGEYRVAPKGGDEAQREARAYYTTDLADAVGTAKAERSRAVLGEAALTATLDRLLHEPHGRNADTVRDFPAERLVSRFADAARGDSDNER
jgi:hypothetical protein